jgi:hypothetical protein
MIALLLQYLRQKQQLPIPGIGSIVVERVPAQTDFVNKQILPPSYHLRFDKYFDSPDKDFFSFLAAHSNLADFEVMKWYNEWAYELRANIKPQIGNTVEGLGSFTKDESGDIQFKPAFNLVPFLRPVVAERIIQSNATHTVLVGNTSKEYTTEEIMNMPPSDSDSKEVNWQRIAWILALIALVFLLWHLFNPTGNPSPTGIRY